MPIAAYCCRQTRIVASDGVVQASKPFTVWKAGCCTIWTGQLGGTPRQLVVVAAALRGFFERAFFVARWAGDGAVCAVSGAPAGAARRVLSTCSTSAGSVP